MKTKDNRKRDLDSTKAVEMEKRMKVLGLPQKDIEILEEIKYGESNTRHRERRLV